MADTTSLEGPHKPAILPDLQTRSPNVCDATPFGLEIAHAPDHDYTSKKRITQAHLQESSMPVSATSQSLLASLPSFMSVFGSRTDIQGAGQRDIQATQAPLRSPGVSKRPHNISHFSSPTIRRGSASTFESTESSPTTTISTFDSSSLTEPSPSSSPESPNSSLPVSPFKSLRTHSVGGQDTMEQKDSFSISFPTLPALDRAHSPNKKMRNMKNLSVNTSASHRPNPQLSKLAFSNTSTSASNHASSAPPTPAFIVPPKAPRKKPSNLGLTISTPESSNPSQSLQDRPSVVAQTPSDSQLRTLRMLQKASSGPLFSPTVAPEGGMRLPPFGTTSSSTSSTGSRLGKSRPPLSVSPCSSYDNTVSSPVTRQTLDHVQEETDYDVPLSQEVKSPAYPQGPVCIYDPHVYLYLEPSHVEAREFDVVLNVAREVRNPFTSAADDGVRQQTEHKGVHTALDSEDCLAGRDSTSEPQTAASDQSFSSAFEVQTDEPLMTLPSTPKASRPNPEYIHVPWDHNTNVVEDLLRLCELIDDRVRQKKRVLVHCQCGVSRSASLVVAYGLYKNPQLTVQEAYDAVKFRSRWIGPNMNLIYQLSEFKSKLTKTHGTGVGASAWHSWRSLGSNHRANSNVVLSPDLTASSLRIPPQKSLSTPAHSSPMNRQLSASRANSFSLPPSSQLAQSSSGGEVTPGPSSAPPNIQFCPAKMSAEPEKETEVADGGSTTSLGNPPRLMDTEQDVTLSPSTMEREAIEEKEAAPAGGVANDLQEVAKDLAPGEHGTEPLSMSKPMESDKCSGISPSTTTHNVARSDDFPTLDVPIPTPNLPGGFSPSPILPGGFSSLRSRRQGPLPLRPLPLHKEKTQLAMSQLPEKTFDPDVPPTPSLLSPRAAEFTASPFHRTAAGDLVGTSVYEQGLMSPRSLEEDPRSPHHRGEAPITRSIFDMI